MSKPSIKRKALLLISIILLTIQTWLIGVAACNVSELYTMADDITNTVTEMKENMLKTTVLPQMTRQLNQVREAWTTYTTTYNMDIMSDAGLNSKNLKMFIDTSVCSIRAFGGTGYATVFDSISGEVYFSRKDGAVDNISDAAAATTCQNPTAVQLMTDYLALHNDILGSEFIVDLFSESNMNYVDATDFDKYPLGEHNRQFIQKIMLPLPNVGARQLVVLLSVNESDIFANFDEMSEVQYTAVQAVNTAARNLLLISIVCIFFSFILISIANFLLIKIIYHSAS